MGLAVIAASYWLVWSRKSDPTTEFCFLCVAMLVGNTVTWGHYLVFLIFPLAVAMAKLRDGMTEARLFGLALLVLALNALNLADQSWVERRFALTFITNYIPLAGIVALGCLFAAWLVAGSEDGIGTVSSKAFGQKPE
jgi:hypothetical protein